MFVTDTADIVVNALSRNNPVFNTMFVTDTADIVVNALSRNNPVTRHYYLIWLYSFFLGFSEDLCVCGGFSASQDEQTKSLCCICLRQ
ncbi:hypothetical protein QE152_g31503 [Popillia japonica]|uniref:Uncharacterized protein n=1 Tax=Popillia japonica TaxID=7064 RepID=A0AAW1J131_POPJA